jgi:hypothetical protein
MTENIGTERKIINDQLQIDGLVNDKIFRVRCVDLFPAQFCIVGCVLVQCADMRGDLINAVQYMPQADKAVNIIRTQFFKPEFL